MNSDQNNKHKNYGKREKMKKLRESLRTLVTNMDWG